MHRAIAQQVRRWVIGITTVALCASTVVAAEARGVPADPGSRLSIVSYASDPPGHIQEAPGGGRIPTPALLYTPAAGDNPHGPAIVILDQGPGSHPLEQGQAARFAAERLAAAGYTVMSVYDGQERGFATQPFENTAYAVQGALDYLEVMGHEDFVLVGQGYGAIVAAYYLATQPDTLLDNGGEKRVKAVVLLNPLTELRRYPGTQQLGDGYDALVARAKASVASGRGVYPKTLEPGHGAGADTDPWILTGPYVAPAEGFLNYWGPEAAERNARALDQLAVPTLIIANDGDESVSMDKLRALRTTSTVELVPLHGSNPRLRGREAEVTTEIAHWLRAHDLGVRPRVRVEALDVVADDGRELQGVLYRPEGKGDRSRPAVMLVSGRTGDTVQSSTDWMGWRIAQRGYAVFAPGMRISGTAGIEAHTLADTASDLGRWVDRVAKLGYRRIVMGGHSNGGIWLSNYLSITHDPRVVGTIYYAPTRDEPTYTRRLDGDAVFERKVKEAQAAVAAGRGQITPIGLLSAQSFLDFTGPDSRAMHTERIQEFDLPGLAIVGGRDALMDADFVAEFRKKYRGNLTVVSFPDGSHGLRESKDRVGETTAAWLDRSFPRR